MNKEQPKKRILHSLANDILERIGYKQTAYLLVRIKRRIDEGMSVDEINTALLPKDFTGISLEMTKYKEE